MFSVFLCRLTSESYLAYKYYIYAYTFHLHVSVNVITLTVAHMFQHDTKSLTFSALVAQSSLSNDDASHDKSSET